MGPRRVNAAYIDTSALVKLFKAEPETEALRAALGDWPVQVASELIRVEVMCTARRLGGDDILQRANETLERINLIPISSEILEARHQRPHPATTGDGRDPLATALTTSEDLGAMFVYDNDLHAAAQAHDLNPLAPR